MNNLASAANRAIKSKPVYDWVREFIRSGGYARPTDLFNSLPKNLPPKISILFENPKGPGILYSQTGAMLLMEQLIRGFNEI